MRLGVDPRDGAPRQVVALVCMCRRVDAGEVQRRAGDERAAGAVAAHHEDRPVRPVLQVHHGRRPRRTGPEADAAVIGTAPIRATIAAPAPMVNVRLNMFASCSLLAQSVEPAWLLRVAEVRADEGDGACRGSPPRDSLLPTWPPRQGSAAVAPITDRSRAGDGQTPPSATAGSAGPGACRGRCWRRGNQPRRGAAGPRPTQWSPASRKASPTMAPVASASSGVSPTKKSHQKCAKARTLRPIVSHGAAFSSTGAGSWARMNAVKAK